MENKIISISHTIMNRFRLLIPLLFVVFLIWTGATPAQAHAELVRSIPEANASLARSPAQIDLYFSEAVAPKLSKLNVLDLDGNVVDARDGRVDPADDTHMSATLLPLADGVYTVVWSVLSADDGHATSGSFPFSVGNVDSNAVTSSQNNGNNSPLPLSDGFTKGILYTAVAGLMGGILFTFFVWNQSRCKASIPSENQLAYDQFYYRFTLAGLIVLGVVNLVSLILEAGHVNGTLIGLPWQPAFATVLLDTRIGVLVIARLCLAIILAGLLLPQSGRWNRWSGLAFSLILLLTLSLESHAAAEARPILPVLADWIHLIAVSVWVGGLFSFLGGMWIVCSFSLELRSRITSILIPRFSMMALVSVGVLTISGLYSAILRIGSLNALLYTRYGQALIFKLDIALPLILLGGVNFLVTTPAMRRSAVRPVSSPALVTRFLWLLTGEVVLGIAILIWVGVFTNLPPARVTSTSTGFYQQVQVDDLTMAFNIDPDRPGINTFSAFISAEGQPVSNAESVSLEFAPQSGMMPASNASLTNLGNGAYSLRGGYFGMPDTWDVKLVVARQGRFDVYADFKVDNTAPAGPAIPWRTVAASLLILMAFCYAFAFRTLDRNTRRWVGLGLLPAGVLVLIGVVLILQMSFFST